jgi:hypothetical protein
MINYDSWKKYWDKYLETKKLDGMCWSCMLPDSPEFFHDRPNSNCSYREFTTPLLWLCRNCEVYQHRVHQHTDGVVASVDDFDAFLHGILNGTEIVLRDWYHLKMVMQTGWPAVETTDELEQAWCNATAAFTLQKSCSPTI